MSIMSIGINMRRYRKYIGLSVEILRKKAGIPQTTWYAYESGEQIPKVDILKNIANVLSVSVFDLYPEFGEDSLISPDERRMQNVYARLSIPGKQKMLRQLEEIETADKVANQARVG